MNQRIAAIDFGLKRIGIALSDLSQTLASPFKVVEGGRKAVENVVCALQNQPLAKIIVGLPLLLNGKEGDMAAAVRAFAKALETALNIPILLIDERLSSAQAEKRLKESSFNRKERSSKIDTAAATLLLQQYLDHPELGLRPKPC